MDALRSAIARYLERTQGAASDVQVDARPLGGGLESPVLRVGVRYADAHGAPRRLGLVAKLLEGAAAGEARVYERVVDATAPDFSPRHLGTHWLAPDRCLLLLERVRRASTWPWRDTALRYHLWRAADEAAVPGERAAGYAAAADWRRVLRRADAIWR